MDEKIKFLNTKQIADALGCSLPTARNLMLTSPDFPVIRVGKNLKVNQEAFLEWCRKRRV